MPSSPRRTELLTQAKRLINYTYRFKQMASLASTGCHKCMPVEENEKLVRAVSEHERLLNQAGIPFQFVLLRGSSLHLPFLRRWTFHFNLPSDGCPTCQKYRADFKTALTELKKRPADADLVTVGIPQEKTRDFVQLSKTVRAEGVLDLTAHITREQIKNPWFTYSSFFNLDRLRIPARPDTVGPIKYARHLAAMMYFLHAYPVIGNLRPETPAVPSRKPTNRRDSKDAARLFGQVGQLSAVQSRFRRHLNNLTDEQLEEFNRVMAWFLRKEAYTILNPGGSKQDREKAIGSFSPVRSENLQPLQNDLLVHVDTLHRYRKDHATATKKK